MTSAAAAVAAEYDLTILVRNGAGAALHARLEVRDALGNPIPPSDPSIPFYTAYSGHSYFYTKGSAVVRVPEGDVRIIASHGPEYTAIDQVTNVTGDTAVFLDLPQIFDLRRTRWHSGDTHVHIAHGGEGDVFTIEPADLTAMSRAEDVAVTCALSNGLHFTGDIDPARVPDHALYFGMEYRSALFGHMGLIGLQSLINQGCCIFPGSPFPLNREIAASAHDQGALVVMSHPVTMDPDRFLEDSPDWPGSGFARELPVLAVGSEMDAYDIFSYSNTSQDMSREIWFDLLNLGYRIPLSVGTDASVNRWFDPPMGGYRVYVQIEGARFKFDKWLIGLRSGLSFATNGPLPVLFSLDGIEVGGTLSVPEETRVLSGTLHIKTRDPVDYADIIVNGDNLRRIHLGPGTEYTEDFTITLRAGDTWAVARVVGPQGHVSSIGPISEAITSPIWFDRTGTEVRGRDQSVDMFVGWVEDLELLVSLREDGGDPEAKSAVLAELARVRQLLDPRQARGDDILPHVRLFDRAADSHPAPLIRTRDFGRRVELAVTGLGSARIEIVDVRGRVAARFAQRPLPATFTWDATASGVYFARVTDSAGRSSVQRIIRLP